VRALCSQRMSKLLVLLLCFVVACAIAADPARPNISPIFHADVSVSLRQGPKAYRGGGVYAVDTKNNRARTDYRLEDVDAHEQYVFIHILERYDLGARYTIEEDKCHKLAITGQLENPWEFVAKAKYTGSGTFRGQKYDEWQYDDQQWNSTTRLAVESSDVNTPVFLNTHQVLDGVISQWDIIFEEFDVNEPQAWVFYVPQICENITKAQLEGDVNSVIYFANNNWNCANVACSSRVAAGTGQPGYACAEFTARSLAYGSYIPGLSATASQASYTNYKGNNLCVTTSLAKALSALGFVSGGSVRSASALFGDAGDGSWSHACIGIGAGVVDCHNNARQGIAATGVMFKGIDAIWSP